jgi:hypothetical protein
MEKKKKKKKKKNQSVGYSLVKRLRSHFTALMCNFFFFNDVSKFVTSYDMSSVQLGT